MNTPPDDLYDYVARLYRRNLYWTLFIVCGTATAMTCAWYLFSA